MSVCFLLWTNWEKKKRREEWRGEKGRGNIKESLKSEGEKKGFWYFFYFCTCCSQIALLGSGDMAVESAVLIWRLQHRDKWICNCMDSPWIIFLWMAERFNLWMQILHEAVNRNIVFCPKEICVQAITSNVLNSTL